MPASKIHCDFYEIDGPDWTKVDDDKASAITRTIATMDWVGEDPARSGFVGTTVVNDVIAGFFAIQYEAELMDYDEKKKLRKRFDAPFERLFFMLFAKTGKLVLQTRKFADIPLNMEIALSRFQSALSLALQQSRVGIVLTLRPPAEEEIDSDIFRVEFRRSSRVSRLSVEKPNPDKIPEGFVYYNPKFDRNTIIRESHQHDYAEFQKVDLEASPTGNLQTTHMAKDLVEVGKPTFMRYYVEGHERILRKVTPRKFELYVDVDAESVDQRTISNIMDRLRLEIGLPIHLPTISNEVPQRSLFDYLEGKE